MNFFLCFPQGVSWAGVEFGGPLSLVAVAIFKTNLIDNSEVSHKAYYILMN